MYVCVPAPRVEEVRDKPIVSYVGDSVVLQCKMEDPKPKPNSWTWYRANGTSKVAEPFMGSQCSRPTVKATHITHTVCVYGEVIFENFGKT